MSKQYSTQQAETFCISRARAATFSYRILIFLPVIFNKRVKSTAKDTGFSTHACHECWSGAKGEKQKHRAVPWGCHCLSFWLCLYHMLMDTFISLSFLLQLTVGAKQVVERWWGKKLGREKWKKCRNLQIQDTNWGNRKQKRKIIIREYRFGDLQKEKM